MDYKEKYEQALRRAKKLLEDMDKKDYFASNGDIENIFPELKESEDERIRKWLINEIKIKHHNLDEENIEFVDKAITWLEKQGKQNSVFTMPPFKAENFYVSKVDGKIHDMTYNPTDKVEPKFKVGDWISGYYTSYKVMAIHSKGYMVEDTDGNKINILFENEKFYHLFTIADAKAGDVLVYETDEVEWIFIYREIVPAASEVPHDLLRYYFLLEGNYFNWNGVSAMITDDYKLYLKPATKEQRDVLFSKMKEAGYEWDSEKKELKKIEVKTLNADKVIEWLKNNGWCTVGGPKVEIAQINKFKKDFGL